MKKTVISFVIAIGLINGLKAQTSLYNIKLKAINGIDTIKFNEYSGKKILIVNIACLSESANQLGELQQLYQRFKDSGLVIIACPSNSFQKEPGSNEEINQLCRGRFGANFPISEKMEVIGANSNDLFKWLASKSLNSVMNLTVKGNFNKILISRQGSIIGVFAENVKPLDDIVVSTISRN